MTKIDLEKRRLAVAARGVGVMCNFAAERAENSTVWDTAGRAYTDFAGGIGVLNTGHRHPTVMAAVKEQLERFTHTCYQVVPYDSYLSLAQRLNALVPVRDAKTIFFTTGAEAVENAIKIARAATRRSGVIAFSSAFHGRTLLGMALTGKISPYKSGFGPFPAEVYHAPFPSDLHGISVEQSLAAIEGIFKCDIESERVAAIVIEPVQGEGGFNVAPVALMTRLRELCDRYGILLIVDEIQSGFARTGKLFAMQHYGVEPDLITMAKSLAGGFPLSAVSGRAAVMDAPAPGALGGTYAGNPLAIAAAHAVLDVIEKEDLCSRSAELGSQLREFLQAFAVSNPAVAEVRGIGSMLAIEFRDPTTGAPSAEITRSVQQAALARGLILLTCGTHANVVRFLYPLTVPAAQFAAALQTLKLALTEAVPEAEIEA
ncbi:4-aminobutyrate--2-oxoglutarate transaminase [Variovorax sp. LjRoot84]|uniref:4-aminobutyrate--2-oxoglutarate transaminase n=1 Tax=Variovorax sp. LjRoot84 TaxID=3342340 RepID=UPI003ECF2EB2